MFGLSLFERFVGDQHQVDEVVFWFANDFWLGASWFGHLLDVDSLVLVGSFWDPDLLVFDGVGIVLDGPWMGSIGVHRMRLSSSDFAIAHQLTGIVIPHQLDSVLRIILEDDWNSDAT